MYTWSVDITSLKMIAWICIRLMIVNSYLIKYHIEFVSKEKKQFVVNCLSYIVIANYGNLMLQLLADRYIGWTYSWSGHHKDDTQ